MLDGTGWALVEQSCGARAAVELQRLREASEAALGRLEALEADVRFLCTELGAEKLLWSSRFLELLREQQGLRQRVSVPRGGVPWSLGTPNHSCPVPAAGAAVGPWGQPRGARRCGGAKCQWERGRGPSRYEWGLRVMEMVFWGRTRPPTMWLPPRDTLSNPCAAPSPCTGGWAPLGAWLGVPTAPAHSCALLKDSREWSSPEGPSYSQAAFWGQGSVTEYLRGLLSAGGPAQAPQQSQDSAVPSGSHVPVRTHGISLHPTTRGASRALPSPALPI